MTYSLTAEPIKACFAIPAATWTTLNKRACLISARNWGGGYYTRYSQFDRLVDLQQICDRWRNWTFPTGLRSAAQNIQAFTQVMDRLLGQLKALASAPETLPSLKQSLVEAQQQTQKIIGIVNSVSTDVAKFQILNEAAEVSIQNQPIDESDRFYMAELGPTTQAVADAAAQLLLGWTELQGQLNLALSDLQNTPVDKLSGFMARVDIKDADEFWAGAAVDAAALIQNIDGQQHYLSGNYLYDKSPIQEGVGYYIAFLTGYGLKMLYAGDRVQDASGGGYSYHLGAVPVGSSTELSTNGSSQWFFTKAGGYGCYRITNQRLGPSFSLDVFGGSMLPVMLPSGSYTGQYWRFYGDRLTNTYIQNKGWLSLVGSAVAMAKEADSNLGISTSSSFAVLLPPVQTDILYETTPLATRVGDFGAVYAQADGGGGIGGYDLKNGGDRGFAFDYDGSGKLDHLVFYRPGAGAVYILQNKLYGTFVARYAQGSGIGGYNLLSPDDRGFAFDYDGSGKLDHLVFYRPGRGTVFIVKNNRDGTFSSVYAQGDPGNGIGGYNLLSPGDRGFAFDYDGSGKLDHLVFYRPGRGAVFILKNHRDGTFSPVYAEGDPGNGIGTYNLLSPDDRGFAFDYDGSGKLDHLVFYRPGRGAVFIVKNNRNGTFSSVYAQGDPGQGIGTYNLLSPADRGFAYDYDGSGKLDHLVFYRPGRGAIFILKNNRNGTFTAVYAQGDPSDGIGGYDLKGTSDRGFAYDYSSSGQLDHLVFYRPGSGAIYINQHLA